ncbi:MAG: T9SS type A sorting domain-containing protein, partial [Bacteroidota bacterium]|nr:T9SS type A sorting domain-containing protein [Bacteroidota bacterium]
STGIAVFKSAYNTYCCNSVPGNGTGISFSGDCDQSHLKHNIMSSNNYGLHCGSNSWIGLQKLGYSNTWPGSAANFEAIHNGSDDNMRNSRFDVTFGPSDFFPDPPPNPPDIWFETQPGNNKSCLSDFSCALPQRPDTIGDDDDKYFRFYNDDDVLVSPTDEYTADPQSDWGIYANGQSWNSKIQLLEKLELFPELLGQSSLVDSFHNNNQSGVLRDYYSLRLAIRKSANISQSSYTILKNINNGIISSIAQIELIDEQLSQAGADTVSLMNQRTAELNTLNNLRLQYEAEATSNESLRMSVLNNLYNQAFILPSDNALQAEEKAISLHLIQYLIQGKDYLTTTALSNIYMIANQCIHQNSYAVLIARMLYQKAIEYEFNDDSLCTPSQPIVTSTKNNEIENRIRLYPNPTKNWVIIENLNKDDSILKIDVLDIHGRYIQKESNGKSLDKINLSTANLKSGIYLLKIGFSNDKVILKKLLIE